MLQKIVLQCQYSEEQKAGYNWGSIFHGIIMERLPEDIAQQLHDSQLKPFSQYVTSRNSGHLEWTIGLWDEYMAEYLVKAIMPATTIEIKHKEITLDVTDVKRTKVSDKEYFDHFFVSEKPCRRYEIEFKTPCTHKQDGSYAVFPTIELIMQNLSRRFNAFKQDYSLDDPEIIAHLAENMRIVRYSLHSSDYYLEQTRISGYMGRMTVSISGPEQLARLAGAILSLAEHSGIGIKTALGMGGVSIKPII